MPDFPAPEGYEWVTCNAREYGAAGHSLHLIATATRKKEAWQTTVCGCTANLRGIWRKPTWNSTKPRCRTCYDFSQKGTS